jgi:hypothetical protein
MDGQSWAPFPQPTFKCFQGLGNTCTIHMEMSMELDITIKTQWFRVVKMCNINKRPSNASLDTHIGRRDLLSMGPAQLQWNGRHARPTLVILPPWGRSMLQAWNPPPRSIEIKWHGIIPSTLDLVWGNVWDNMHSKHDGAFSWSIWPKAVAVNSWRSRFIADIDDKCQLCIACISKTIAYKFWDYRVAF